MNILAIRSEQPFRVTAFLDGAPSTTPGDYVFTREDGGPTSVRATLAFLLGAAAVELALSEGLLDGVVYIVSLPGAPGAPSARVAYRKPLAQRLAAEEDDDPEADLLGVDVCWTDRELGPDGDLQRRRGRDCVVHDLVVMAGVEPGELFHRPDEGAALPRSVNGPSGIAARRRMEGALRRQWQRDDRVQAGGVTIDIDIATDGTLEPVGKVQLAAVPDLIEFEG